jgi:adenylate cyclase
MEETVKNSEVRVTWPIGLKVFGIAASLLLLMASVTYITTRNLDKLNDHLTVLTEYLIPLDHSLSNIQFTQLIQRLVLDRIEAYKTAPDFESAQKDAELLIKEAGGCSRDQIMHAVRGTQGKYGSDFERDVVRHEVYRTCGDTILLQAEGLMQHALLAREIATDPVQLRKVTQIEEKLKYFGQARAKLRASTMKQLTGLPAQSQETAKLLESQVNDDRLTVARSIRELVQIIQSSTKGMASQSTAMERSAFRFSWIVTIIAAAFGLFYAALVSRNLVRPVRQLVGGVKAIQEGNLNTQLPITSNDEIGVLTTSFNHMASELKEKELITETFGKYVDPRIVKNILDKASASIDGEKQTMTVQFSDIKGFSNVCEQLTAERTVRFLNRYFSLMSDAILANKGIIDKYIGDAVMSFWGPPFVSDTDHAGLACLAALDQMASLQIFNQMLPETTGLRKGLPAVAIRIGLCTGDVTLGSIGSEMARSYTVIGDSVNLASRIEQASKEYGTQIIISEATMRMAGDMIETRELDIFMPAGKEEPVRIFELLGRKDQVSAQILEVRDSFEKGLATYREKDWQGAAEHFKRCLAIDPADSPSKVFLSRARHLRENPPGAEWSGIWMQRKV